MEPQWSHESAARVGSESTKQEETAAHQCGNGGDLSGANCLPEAVIAKSLIRL